MNHFFEIDDSGKILSAEVFSDEENVPNNYKKAWNSDVILQKPYWDFTKDEWGEGISSSGLLIGVKSAKKEQLALRCKEGILDGFYYKKDGYPYQFSYDKEAQANMAERWQLFQNDMIQEIKVTAHTNDKDVRLTFDKKGYNDLYLASVKHKENCISHYRDDLLPLVEQALTVEQVEAINWDTVVTEPVPSLVIVEDKNTLDKQVDKVKVEQAQGNIELLQLIFSMGGM